ncbi:hypothetical protein GPL15_25940 [Clostridium sp. MCC353]|uniref:hypothetical protein n=1 Tax=Clostridium sp. MCC353 TaxID=2592646 RepID=UPI001C02585D|nr:hypothetical protein [Clostridium sp. MCC353]MBT9779916.1 hypothetical protein [Clostridium sp. MCC353]
MKKSQTLFGFMMMVGFGCIFMSKTGKEPVLCIKNGETGDTYVKTPVKKGDILYFGRSGCREEEERNECCRIGKSHQLIVGEEQQPVSEYAWYNSGEGRQELCLNGRVLALPEELPEDARLVLAVERRASYE